MLDSFTADRESQKLPMHLVSVSSIFRNSGVTALVDLLKEYNGLSFIGSDHFQFKLLESGIYGLIDRLQAGENLSRNQFKAMRGKALCYAKTRNLPIQILEEAERVTRLPIAKVSRSWLGFNYRRFKGYSQAFPDYLKSTTALFRQLADLNHRGKVDANSLEQQLAEIFHAYFTSLLQNFKDGLKNPLVLKHLVRPENPLFPRIMPYAKLLFVARDPRDQYCDIAADKNPGVYIGHKRIDLFIERYRENTEAARRFFGEALDNVMEVQFEDMVYHYDQTRRQVEVFLGLTDCHCASAKHFDPKISKANTRLFEKFEKKQDIKAIERELADCLYPFPATD